MLGVLLKKLEHLEHFARDPRSLPIAPKFSCLVDKLQSAPSRRAKKKNGKNQTKLTERKKAPPGADQRGSSGHAVFGSAKALQNAVGSGKNEPAFASRSRRSRVSAPWSPGAAPRRAAASSSTTKDRHLDSETTCAGTG